MPPAAIHIKTYLHWLTQLGKWQPLVHCVAAPTFSPLPTSGTSVTWLCRLSPGLTCQWMVGLPRACFGQCDTRDVALAKMCVNGWACSYELLSACVPGSTHAQRMEDTWCKSGPDSCLEPSPPRHSLDQSSPQNPQTCKVEKIIVVLSHCISAFLKIKV